MQHCRLNMSSALKAAQVLLGQKHLVSINSCGKTSLCLLHWQAEHAVHAINGLRSMGGVPRLLFSGNAQRCSKLLDALALCHLLLLRHYGQLAWNNSTLGPVTVTFKGLRIMVAWIPQSADKHPTQTQAQRVSGSTLRVMSHMAQ